MKKIVVDLKGMSRGKKRKRRQKEEGEENDDDDDDEGRRKTRKQLKCESKVIHLWKSEKSLTKTIRLSYIIAKERE